MPDSNETIFVGTVLRIKKFNGFRIGPNGLGFFEPNSMFPEIGLVLVLVPLKSHVPSVCYSIYFVNRKWGGMLDQTAGKRPRVTQSKIIFWCSVANCRKGLHALVSEIRGRLLIRRPE